MKKDMVAVVDAVENVVKNVVASQEAAKNLITYLPAEAIRNGSLAVCEKDPQLMFFQQQLGQQHFDKTLKETNKKISAVRLEECRNLFIQNCDVLFDEIPEDMTIMEVLDHAVKAKIEDAYQLTLKDYKAQTAAKITEIIMAQKDPEVIMAMDLLPESVKMLMLQLTAVSGEEVENFMEEAASTLEEEPEVIEAQEEPVAQVYKDSQIESVLKDAAVWLNDEEYGTEDTESLGIVEIDSVRRYSKTKEFFDATIETVEELFLTEKFKMTSLVKCEPIMEQAAKALMAANRDLHMTACKSNKEYNEVEALEQLTNIANLIRSPRKKDYFYNYLQQIVNGTVEVALSDSIDFVDVMRTFIAS